MIKQISKTEKTELKMMKAEIENTIKRYCVFYFLYYFGEQLEDDLFDSIDFQRITTIEKIRSLSDWYLSDGYLEKVLLLQQSLYDRIIRKSDFLNNLNNLKP